MTRATSWTGSEDSRPTDNRGCSHAPATTSRFVIRAGTRCEVSKTGGRGTWLHHLTKVDLMPGSPNRSTRGGWLTFSVDGWQIRLHKSQVHTVTADSAASNPKWKTPVSTLCSPTTPPALVTQTGSGGREGSAART